MSNGIPKRADVYWFFHVNVTDEPYTVNYNIETFIKNDIYYVELNLGFRINPRVDFYFRQIVKDMIDKNEVDPIMENLQKYQNNKIGDFKFVVMDSFLSYDNAMNFWKNLIMKSYYNLKHLSVKESENFGLEESNLIIEKYPLIVVAFTSKNIIRKS